MKSRWTDAMKRAVPRGWRLWLRRRLHGATYSGNYASWAAARAASVGYDAALIFERTLAAARAVRSGAAEWDRDTVLFNAPAVNQPVLAALRHAAAANGGRLHLMDFGGALGSTWWQHRACLGDLVDVRWSVVEQPQVVAAGQREFTAGALRFYETVEACCAIEHPTVALFSSVLLYVENPHQVLQDIADRPFRQVIIDRTGFTRDGTDRLTVQQVPRSIYPASYPCWFFDRARLLRPFARDWRVAAEWQTMDAVDIAADHGGLMLERIAFDRGHSPP
ncbi:MAG: hypothetical protein JWM35_2637 [Verrucomicrobia bacterium]|nr:hypothetical protein [Verrucomicrobiota bacterium]